MKLNSHEAGISLSWIKYPGTFPASSVAIGNTHSITEVFVIFGCFCLPQFIDEGIKQ